VDQLIAVSGANSSFPNLIGKGAALAANWPSFYADSYPYYTKSTFFLSGFGHFNTKIVNISGRYDVGNGTLTATTRGVICVND
jgi:hypothetical protein